MGKSWKNYGIVKIRNISKEYYNRAMRRINKYRLQIGEELLSLKSFDPIAWKKEHWDTSIEKIRQKKREYFNK